MRRGLPYFLLFSIYAIINTYLPIMLRTVGFSAAEIGLLLGIIEVTGVIIPFFISLQLDKTGRYGFTMSILGLDIALLLLPLLAFHSFLITAICLGIFAAGFKGLVPVLDGFTAKELGPHNTQYGKIRSLGSIGFVCTGIFLQLSPLISGKNPASIIISVSAEALLFVAALFWVPGLRKQTGTAHGTGSSIPANETETALSAAAPDRPSADAALPRDTKPETEAFFHHARQFFTAFPRPFWEALLLIFLAFLGLVPCQRFFSLYVEEYLKSNASAGLWALSAMAEIPVMLFSGTLIKRFGKERLLALCLLSIAVRNLCYIAVPGITGAVAGQLLHSLSFGLFHPLSVLLCASHSNGKTATAMTFYTAVNGIAYVIGSMAGGYIIDYVGYPALFISFGLFPVAGIVLYALLMRRPGY